jgi:hypothetical protein
MTNTKTLRFYDLEFSKMRDYIELSNKIDTRLGEKFVKKIPLRVAMAFLTGGTSLILSTGRQLYQLNKKSAAIDAAKAFVENERRLRDCAYVEWNTFPESHIVIGGGRMQTGAQPTLCPLCKWYEMRKFVSDSDHEIVSCSSCSRIGVIKVSRTREPAEFLVPGVFATAIPFTGGIEHLQDIAHTITDLLADIADAALDLVA